MKKRWHVGCANGEGSVFADEGRMSLGPGGTTLTPICTVYDFQGDRDENLRLIAAAPELLDALKSFLLAPSIGSNGPVSATIVVREYHLRAAWAAVQKATGGLALDEIDTATGEGRRCNLETD